MIFLFALLWIALGIALFGLGRLLLAKRGTEEDWNALIAFGRLLPLDLLGPAGPPGRWAKLIALSPPGLLGPDRAAVDANTLSVTALNELVRVHQRMLQSEMKFFAHRMVDPSQWLLSGLRGLLSIPLGLAVDFDAAHRARRRALEANPDFQRVVYAVLAVLLFALALALWMGWPDAVLWLRRVRTD